MSVNKLSLTDDKGSGWASPSPSGAAVTPDDDTDLAQLARLYVGVTGDLTVILANDTAPVTFTDCPAGWCPLIVRRVMATDTAATDIVALFMD